jgi:hypothetical protein
MIKRLRLQPFSFSIKLKASTNSARQYTPVIARRNDEAICSNLKLPAYDAGDCHVPRNDEQHPLAVMLNSVQHLLVKHNQARQEILRQVEHPDAFGAKPDKYTPSSLRGGIACPELDSGTKQSAHISVAVL